MLGRRAVIHSNACARDGASSWRQVECRPTVGAPRPAGLWRAATGLRTSITLLVLEIESPPDYSHLVHAWSSSGASYLAYSVTFLFIGQVWTNHHVMFDHIRAADRFVQLLSTPAPA